ncbi:hypothetical protein [Flavobacterium sp.]
MRKIILFLLFHIASFSQVGVNTTAPKGALDVESTTNGVLIPRVQLLSIADITTIVNPNTGPLQTSTLVYNVAPAGTPPNNVVAGFYYWNSALNRWIPIAGTAGWETDGNTAITSPAMPAVYGTSTIGATENYLGTTDNNDITFATNNIERMRVERTSGNVGIGLSDPTEKLHVYTNSNATKSSIFGYAQQLGTGSDYDNIGVKGSGRGTGGWGLGTGVMGIGETANSYYATGIYAHLGTTTPSIPLSNQALYANGNSLGNAGIFMGGSVGIGTATPTLARLQVDGMTGNTAALFRASATSQGISMVADWPGIYFNCYYNGAIRSMAGSGYASIINTDQASGGLVFQTTNVVNPASGTAIASIPTRMTITGAGNVGIGTTVPSRLLHVNSATSGAIRIVDGTQANNRVLTSDAAGVATWRNIAINNVVGNISATGVTVWYNTGPYLQTGSSITLPPGKFAVNVNMLMARASLVISPNDSFFWVRTSFSDSAGVNPTPSGDIIGSNLISGNHPGTSYYSMLSGTVIIENTGAFNKTYYYIAGSCVSANTTQNITGFGSTYWAEDNIIAYRLD